MIQKIKRFTGKLYRSAFKMHKNTIWLILLSVVTALSQFIVYALINKNLGKELLGVWSLVVAATSIGQISSFGFSNSLVRYLPEMLVKDKKEDVGKMLGTINSSNFFLTLPILFVLYFPAVLYAKDLLNAQQLLIFKSVIPISMAGLFINNLFSVYSYLLDAMQQYYLRCIIQISGWTAFLILSIFLMPGFGLMGVAIAFAIQNILQFIAILALIHNRTVLVTVYPLRFDRSSFRKISSFGLKSQYINILVIFFDPLIKFFITKNIGLSATGNYEIANKIVMQARNLLVSTNQVIVPKIVIHKNDGTENNYFNEVSGKNVLFSVSVGMLILLFAPLAVYFFSGRYDNTLIKCIVILNLGWVCNMITSVHYYCSIALDKIGKLVIYHFVLSVTVTVLYLFLNNFLQVKFLYFAVPSAALFAGSVYNSFILSKKLDKVFSWLKSGIFMYFIFVSAMMLFIYRAKATGFFYMIMPILILLYIYWIFKNYRATKLFKIIRN